MRARVLAVSMIVLSLTATPLRAQSESVAPVSVAVTPVSTPSAGQGASEPAKQASQPGGMKLFIHDVGGDYRHFFSKDTAVWMGIGGGVSLAAHAADQAVHDEFQEPDEPPTNLTGGQTYGSFAVQVPLALGWWAVGHISGHEGAADAGRDLLRAQISASSWTYVLKFAVGRTRPNGEPRSFPSGHASATFATAVVLQQHYGWKVGVPAFALATYTAASRVADNKHWVSDAVFGAFLGAASARTVTLHVREARVTVAPWLVPGGGGVLLSAAR